MYCWSLHYWYVPMEILPFGRVAWAGRIRVQHQQCVERRRPVAAASGDVHRRLAGDLGRPELRPAGDLAPAVHNSEQRRR